MTTTDPTTDPIEALIESGLYDLRLNEKGLGFEAGDDFAYRVIARQAPRPDGSIPVQVKVSLPERLKGRVVEGTLMPSASKMLGARAWMKPPTD